MKITISVVYDVIDISGTTRPRTNSLGRPIHNTVSGTINFWRWFGDSVVVDETGRPLVLYKGAYPYDWREEKGEYPGPEITHFDRGEFPAYNAGEPGIKISGFFGDIKVANHFAGILGQRSAVYPVYLAFKNPLVINGSGKKAGVLQFGETGAPFRNAVRSGKYDSVILTNTVDEGTVYISLHPNQAKSVHNVGQFSTKNNDLLANVGIPLVDKNGDPLVVYHGTVSPAIARFDRKHSTRPDSLDAIGVWFTDNPDRATDYGPNVIHAHLTLHSPLILKTFDELRELWDDVQSGGVRNKEWRERQQQRKQMGRHTGSSDAFVEELVLNGHDGVVIQKHGDGEWRDQTAYIVFDDKQIHVLPSITTSSDAAFKAWFRGSKVVDKRGAPKVVYRGGTSGRIEVFNTGRYRRNEQLGFGIHFSEDEPFAHRYAHDPNVARRGKHPHVVAAYLHVVSPLYADVIVKEGSPEYELARKIAGTRFFSVRDDKGVSTTTLTHAINATSPQRAERIVREHGYDGVRYSSTIMTRDASTTQRSTSWIVFESKQVKAVDNEGIWDANSENIYR